MKRYSIVFLCLMGISLYANNVYIVQSTGVPAMGNLGTLDPYRNPVSEGMQRQLQLQQQAEQVRSQRLQNQLMQQQLNQYH